MIDSWQSGDLSPTISADHKAVLRKLTVGDERSVASVLASWSATPTDSGLDGRTVALVRIGVLIAVDAGAAAYQHATAAALAAGASPDEIVDLLPALATSIGFARVAAAAPKLALALGYDVEFALEQ